MIDKKMSEKQFQMVVERLLRNYGYWVQHSTDSRMNKSSGNGFPDIIAYHPVSGTMFAWELKVKPNFREHQLEWLDAFEGYGICSEVLFPPVWRNGDLEDIIRLGAKENICTKGE